MTENDRRDRPTGEPFRTEPPAGQGASRQKSRHRWMMLACCLPMLIIAAVLIFTGTAGTGAAVFALACVAMMATMMLMPGGHRH